MANLSQIPQIGDDEMINLAYYRLSRYKIIEDENGYIWWETHSGFSSVKMGRGFVRGSILFIESEHTSEENGFLKGEFIDKLNRLPKWEKTKYYCTSFYIVKCKADQKGKSPSANNKSSQATTREDVSYRLGQFEIVDKRGCKILWKSYSGRTAMKVGKAFVDGNILFFGRGEVKKTVIVKKDFLERLLLLPAWEKTDYFCRHYTLYSCEANTTCCELGENVLSNKSENDAGDFRKRPLQIRPNIGPRTASGAFTQNHLKTLRSFCSILVSIVFKVLFWLIIVVFKALKLIYDVFALSCKRLLNWILKFLN